MVLPIDELMLTIATWCSVLAVWVIRCLPFAEIAARWRGYRHGEALLAETVLSDSVLRETGYSRIAAREYFAAPTGSEVFSSGSTKIYSNGALDLYWIEIPIGYVRCWIWTYSEPADLDSEPVM